MMAPPEQSRGMAAFDADQGIFRIEICHSTQRLIDQRNVAGGLEQLGSDHKPFSNAEVR